MRALLKLLIATGQVQVLRRCDRELGLYGVLSEKVVPICIGLNVWRTGSLESNRVLTTILFKLLVHAVGHSFQHRALLLLSSVRRHLKAL